MADEAKTPVAIRITRPYADEDEFLARELDTLTRTSIVLLGAQQRPQGVVLRFELALTSGAPLVRGEGRVVAFRERAFEDLAGLTLRFTRLDSRSKALVDKAAAIRDARSRPPPPPLPRASSTPPARSAPIAHAAPSPPDSQPLELDLESTRAEAPHAKRSDRPPPAVTPSRSSPPAPVRSSPPATPMRSSPPPLPNRAAPPRVSPSVRPPTPPTPARAAPAPPPAPLDLESTHAEGPRPQRPPSERPSPPVAAAGPASDRDALLQRLRVRRSSLDEETVKALLAKKPER